MSAVGMTPSCAKILNASWISASSSALMSCSLASFERRFWVGLGGATAALRFGGYPYTLAWSVVATHRGTYHRYEC